ncbi:hypothetical protein L7F22_035682 [Adiantum nelumboides]|nr:hypothetical protein [Adiantum nelumboides]
MHLSLAGRTLGVNQVLLATAWFTTSCWTLYSQALSRLRRLVRNFLWGGSDGTRDTRPPVSWRIVILPRQEGGLGIIDLEMQSVALLSELIVRGLYPREELWMQFMLHGLSSVCLLQDVWMQLVLGEVSVSHTGIGWQRGKQRQCGGAGKGCGRLAKGTRDRTESSRCRAKLGLCSWTGAVESYNSTIALLFIGTFGAETCGTHFSN